MPLVRDMAVSFFTRYTEPDSSSAFDFQKKPGGWYVRVINLMDLTYGPPQLFWSRKDQRYLFLNFPPQTRSDSAHAAAIIASYAKRFYMLTDEEVSKFDRGLYYGYDGWAWDVITTLEASPPTSDSLWESLAMAYDAYSSGYIVQASPLFENGDPDRSPLPDSAVIPFSRVQKYLSFERKSVDAFQHIYQLNKHYKCAGYEIGWQVNTIRVYTATVLDMLGYGQLGAPFLRDVSYPDSILRKSRRLMKSVRPNGILVMDKDTTTCPLLFLQTLGERRDITLVDYSLLVLKRVIAYLDHQSHGTLFDARPSVYNDSAFGLAYFQTDDLHSGEPRLDSFLVTLYTDPGNVVAQGGFSMGWGYRFFSKHPYLTVDTRKVGSFYPGQAVAARISLDIDANYLILSDILILDIVAKNLLSRHIYFTHPLEHPIFLPYCVKSGNGVYEFIPTVTSSF